LMSLVTGAEMNILSALASLNFSLSTEIQNILMSITNEVSGMNASLSDQLNNLLNTMTTDNNALRTWLETVLGFIDANLTATSNILQAQLVALDASVTNFFGDLQMDIAEVLAALQSHDQATGQNHSDIIDALNDLLMGGVSATDIENLKTMLTNLATNVSGWDQSLFNNLMQIVGEIDSFRTNMTMRLDGMNRTLDDISKLDTIIADLNALDQSLAQAENDLTSTIEDTAGQDSDKIDMNTMLLAVLLILMIISLLMNLVMGRRLSGLTTEIVEEEVTEEEEAEGDEEVEFEEE
jgi:hypothetical protein